MDLQTWSQKRPALQPYFSLLCSSEMTFSALCAQSARRTYRVSKTSLLLTNLLLPVICALYVMLLSNRHNPRHHEHCKSTERKDSYLFIMTISVDAHPCEHQILRVKPLFKRFKASFLYHSFDDFFFGLCSNRMWLKK